MSEWKGYSPDNVLALAATRRSGMSHVQVHVECLVQVADRDPRIHHALAVVDPLDR